MPPKAKAAPEADPAVTLDAVTPAAPPDQGRDMQTAPPVASAPDVTPAAVTLIVRESLTINLPGGKTAKVARCVCPAVSGAGVLSVLSAANVGEQIKVAVSPA